MVQCYNSSMTGGNPYDDLRTLDDEVLKEVVREGEARLLAQLQIATAADQRALTLAGFQITAGTAALAGGAALMTADAPDRALASIALLFALAILTAAGIALWTVMPRKFKTPGNQPLNWRTDRWRWPQKGFDIKSARVEQAACLEEQIEANQRHFQWAAHLMHISFYVTIGMGIASAIFLLATLFWRQ
jgi:hypothetical protein